MRAVKYYVPLHVVNYSCYAYAVTTNQHLQVNAVYFVVNNNIRQVHQSIIIILVLTTNGKIS